MPRPGMDKQGLESVIYQAGKGQIQADNQTIKCLEGKHYCYSLWRADGGQNSTHVYMIMQGEYAI